MRNDLPNVHRVYSHTLYHCATGEAAGKSWCIENFGQLCSVLFCQLIGKICIKMTTLNDSTYMIDSLFTRNYNKIRYLSTLIANSCLIFHLVT